MVTFASINNQVENLRQAENYIRIQSMAARS